MPIDLRTPVMSLDFSWLPLDQRRRLELLRADSASVGELMRRVEDPADLRAVMDAVERAGRPGAPAPRPLAPPPQPGAPRADWLAWGEAHQVSGLLNGPAARLYPSWAWNPPPVDVSVLDELTKRPGRQVHYGQLAPTQLRELVASEAAAVREALAVEQARQAQRDQPPEPPFVEAWALLRERRAPLRARFLPVPRGSLTLTSDPDQCRFVARCHPWNDPEDLAVLAFEPLSLTLPDAAGLALVLVDALLDLLTAPEHVHDRAPVSEELRLAPWLRALMRLEEAATVEPLPESDDKRLLGFEVSFPPGYVRPVQCRPKKRGPGFMTRRVEPGRVPEALLTDARERHTIRLMSAGPGAQETVLLALLGHPRVFLDQEGEKVPVVVRAGRVGLALRQGDGVVRVVADLDGTELDLASDSVVFRSGLVVDTLTGALRLSVVSPATERALQALASRPVEVPEKDLPHLLLVLPDLAQALPLAAGSPVLGRPVPPDPRLVLALRWSDGALAVGARVQPLPELAPFEPGEGAELLVARRGGAVAHLVRDLLGEEQRALQALGPLALAESERVGPFDWIVSDPQRALALLDRVRLERGLRVVWEGERLRLADREATAEDLSLTIGSGRDWFGVQGGGRFDGEEVTLRRLLRAALAGQKYLELGPRHWVALGDTLRAQLAAAAATGGDPEEPRLTALHAPLIQSLVDAGADLDAPPEWLAARERLQQARTLQVPLPEGLNAELRPYQEEGYAWLARLASWAPGAVLADDMGLGKTVQAIALLLRRSADGPALVVAPTSVVPNWSRELSRFAPGLRVVTTTEVAGRAERVAAAGPGDVVLASYGVLSNDGATLASRPFATVVLDESQAIKNADTQRARAAHALVGDFRVALSGTPVENRVGELHSLYTFVAPGLLGSRSLFQTRFVEPIELRGDSGRRAAVAALIAPFLLRRTKAEVAPELPPRTDVVVPVELGEAERALYELVRVEALDRLARAQGKRYRLQVFEELTRLRKQACHPRLSDPTSLVPSAKLATALRLLRDLHEGGHRALVFSSFVTHLGLLREAVEAEGFTCCYLDGQTPAKRRQEEVDTFQRGQTDLFLISLKAGGVGLNLTAADYVVHLDPWWNPAAEDQASDRAHRIGQDKPVTVYRLITTGTVEQEIVALHAHKRELAEALLVGGDSARLPDAEELAALLLGSRGDAESLADLERAGRPKLRLVPKEP